MSNTPLRFGLIGTGIWVRDVHAPAAAASDAVRFTSIYGRNPATTNAIATANGVTPHSDLAAFLDTVDVVGFALPPDAQPELALKAIAAGKHLLLEKPVALDSASARAIADGLDAKGLKSLVFFTNLLNPRYLSWIDDVRAVGGWTGGRIDSFSGVMVDPTNPFHSTLRWRAAAGALWDTAPHAVALLTQVFGRVVEVYAAAGKGDLKAATLTHRDGALTTLNLAMDMPPTVPGETVIYGPAGKRAVPAAVLDWTSTSREAYANALRALIASIDGEATTHPDARFGAYVTDVLAAIERSLATKQAVSVN
jgi:predicted dehydrogenase